jgi:hypothetical protein
MIRDRIFSLMDQDEDSNTRRLKIYAYQTIFLVLLVSENWSVALLYWEEWGAAHKLVVYVSSALALASLRIRWRKNVFIGLAFLQLFMHWESFPLTGNHKYLQTIICGLLAILDPESDDEAQLFHRAACWLLFLVLFYSGLQKLVHGYYFEGQFLAFSLWRRTFLPFHQFMQVILPAEEFTRLASYGRAPGAGPYLVSNPVFLFVSNSVYIGEIGLALMLLVRRTRRFAIVGIFGLVFAIEAVARELYFGQLFFATVLLYARADVIRKIVPWVFGVNLFLILMRLGIIPLLFEFS